MARDELLNKRMVFIQMIADCCGDVGKTKIQKISYFLQESVGVPLEYPFRMHYFGPYSEELDRILSLCESVGLIDIQPDPDGFGYHVTTLEQVEGSWIQEYDISKEPEIKQINEAITVLGNIETPRLELYATIHFIDRREGQQDKGRTIEIVKRLKPKFSHSQVENAYQNLKGTKLI